GLGHLPQMRQHLFQCLGPVGLAPAPGMAGTGRGQCAETGALQIACAARIPGVGQEEAAVLVQGAESASALAEIWRGHAGKLRKRSMRGGQACGAGSYAASAPGAEPIFGESSGEGRSGRALGWMRVKRAVSASAPDALRLSRLRGLRSAG